MVRQTNSASTWIFCKTSTIIYNLAGTFRFADKFLGRHIPLFPLFTRSRNIRAHFSLCPPTSSPESQRTRVCLGNITKSDFPVKYFIEIILSCQRLEKICHRSRATSPVLSFARTLGFPPQRCIYVSCWGSISISRACDSRVAGSELTASCSEDLVVESHGSAIGCRAVGSGVSRGLLDSQKHLNPTTQRYPNG